MKILIVAPHPDDEALGAGGLIIKAKEAGDEVFVLFMAVGDSRQFMNGKTYTSTRLEEAQKASNYGSFNYSVVFDQLATKLDTVAQKELIEVIENKISEFRPNIMVIPYQNSYNQDHRAVATACITALRPMPTKLHYQPQTILEMEEPYSWPQAFTPNFYVDLTEIFAKKLGLYICHNSQVPNDITHPRSLENLEKLAGIRGAEIGVKYAEGYRLLRGQL